MTTPSRIRCAVYTRKSSEEGLEQSFNSLDAQREACEAYIVSQRHEGWQLIHTRYDDGGFSGGNMERPALKRLHEDIAAKRVDIGNRRQRRGVVCGATRESEDFVVVSSPDDGYINMSHTGQCPNGFCPFVLPLTKQKLL